MRRCYFLFLLSASILFISCGCSDNPISLKAVIAGKPNPPVLLEVKSIDEKTVKLVFDKEISIYRDSFYPYEAYSDGYAVIVKLSNTLMPGKSENLTGRVIDLLGNTTGFSTPVWGYNSRLADMKITEIATKDEPKTEITVIRGGNTAGAVLYNGIPSSYEGCAVLPSIEVNTGDCIVVWWTDSIVQNYSKDVLADISLKGRGYTYNGIQTLAVSPSEGARVLDCIVYSNKSLKNSGYGSALTEMRVKKAVDNGWWKDVQDPVYSAYTTKLRTLCRYPDSSDTDSSDDWYTARDKGATFGLKNTGIAYNSL